jgi:hypothetical protein
MGGRCSACRSPPVGRSGAVGASGGATITGVDVDDLYGLPLDRFIPERGALARELRNAGARDEAAAVAALRKPSVAAWAVNQLVRTQRREVGELFEAGDGLRAAHDAVLAGRGDGSSLRAAVERERLAAETLTQAARGLLTSDGHELSPTIIERVTDTLHAAALDDDARRQVRDGRLERELRHVGLGVGGGLGGAPAVAPAPAPARRSSRGPGKPADGQPVKRSAAQADSERAMRERARAHAQERAAARVAEREARRRVERAERGAELARERRDRAAAALESAETELGEAEDELGEARDQLSEAERAVRDLPD